MRTTKRTPIILETVRRLFAELPSVEEGPCYGTPGFRVKGKMVARIWEDGETLVVKCGDDERDCRIQANPRVYYVTDHRIGGGVGPGGSATRVSAPLDHGEAKPQLLAKTLRAFGVRTR